MASSMREGYQAAGRLIAITTGGFLLGFGLIELEAYLGYASGLLVVPSVLLGLLVMWLVVSEWELLEPLGL